MKIILIVLSCCACTLMRAQTQLGLKLGTYNGVSNLQLNPALTALDGIDWEIEVSGGSIYSNVDYNIIKDFYSSNGLITDEEKRLNNYYDLLAQKIGFADVEIHGPSATYRYKNHQIGLATGIHGYSDYKMDTEVRPTDQIDYRDTYFEDLLSAPIRFKTQGMLWSSISLHYAYSFNIKDHLKISAGITPKYIVGHKAAFVDLQSQILKEDLGNNDIRVNIDDASVALAGVDTDDGFGSLTEQNGSGFGLDIGWAILLGKSNTDYKWKLGLSVLNIGKINFNTNSSVQEFKDEHYLYSNFNADSDSDIINVVELIKKEVDEAMDRTQIADHFKASLPSALVLHADWGIWNPFFISGAFIKTFNTSDLGLAKPDYLILAPRYEIEQVAIQLPISSPDLNEVNIGLSARLGPITIGADHLMNSIFTNDSFNEGNYYVALKINSNMF